MFTKSAAFYDVLYSWKDYAAEAQRVHEVIRQHCRSTGNHLLEVACGTGNHLPHLAPFYRLEGLDLDDGLLAVARRKNPEVVFHAADMMAFNLGRRFDVVACLFSSIGYVRTLPGLSRAVDCMARHLLPGGVLLIEPFFTPSRWSAGRLHLLTVDQPELKVVRMNRSETADGETNPVSILDFHYLVGTPSGVEHFNERHELGLFTEAQMLEALQSAGLQVTHDPQGLMDRGLYIGVTPDAPGADGGAGGGAPAPPHTIP